MILCPLCSVNKVIVNSSRNELECPKDGKFCLVCFGLLALENHALCIDMLTRVSYDRC